ncbi:MAG TPA: hypothetical protein VHD60_03530 [Candidatus Saccharimonadales bacterium]|nr:hypothetical protein [Candidatus Saccharimonadales bacterium]
MSIEHPDQARPLDGIAAIDSAAPQESMPPELAPTLVEHTEEPLQKRLSPEKAARREEIIDNLAADRRVLRLLGRSGLTLVEHRAHKAIRSPRRQ